MLALQGKLLLLIQWLFRNVLHYFHRLVCGSVLVDNGWIRVELALVCLMLICKIWTYESQLYDQRFVWVCVCVCVCHFVCVMLINLVEIEMFSVSVFQAKVHCVCVCVWSQRRFHHSQPISSNSYFHPGILFSSLLRKAVEPTQKHFCPAVIYPFNTWSLSRDRFSSHFLFTLFTSCGIFY